MNATVTYIVCNLATFEPEGGSPYPVAIKSPKGCIGWYAVFDNEEDAIAFAGGTRGVLEMRSRSCVLTPEETP